MAKSVFLAVLLLCCFVLTSCEPVNFKDCGSVKSKPEEVDVIPCPSRPCELKKGTSVTVEVRFIPNENVTKATTLIYGKIGDVLVPFPAAEPDACKNSGITCPMIAGKEYKFKATLAVKEEYPAIQLVVKWEMTDQNNDMVYCWELPVKIVS